jgi:hypothetical protein
MRIVSAAALLLGLIAAGTAAAQSIEVCLRDLIGRAPAPVAAYIRRYQACMLWNGDEPINARLAHAATTPKRIRDLDCDLLLKDGASLRRQFAHDPAALHALDRSDRALC